MVVTTLALMIIDAQENDSSILNQTIPNGTILNSSALGNGSQNLLGTSFGMNNTTFNSTKPDKSETMNHLRVNDSAELRTASQNKSAFVIGNAAGTNKTAFVLSTPVKLVSDVGGMWYIIQGVPHGYT